MAQEGMWEHVSLQRVSGKSEGEHNTSRNGKVLESHDSEEGSLGRKHGGVLSGAAGGVEISGRQRHPF